ncbi:MAG: hypothetical protein WC130_12330 [Kiritimatiellia bacterium]
MSDEDEIKKLADTLTGQGRINQFDYDNRRLAKAILAPYLAKITKLEAERDAARNNALEEAARLIDHSPGDAPTLAAAIRALKGKSRLVQSSCAGGSVTMKQQ